MEEIVIPSDPGMRLVALARAKRQSVSEPSPQPVPFALGPERREQHFHASVGSFLEFLRLASGAAGVALAMLEASGLRCWSSIGDAPAPGCIASLDNSLAGECVRTGQIIGCADTVRARPEALPARSVLLLPLPLLGAPAGLVGLFWRQPQAITDSIVAVAQTTISTLGVVAEILLFGDDDKQPPINLRSLPASSAVPQAPEAPERKRLLGLPCRHCSAYFFSDERSCPVCGTPKADEHRPRLQ